jgi:hypothetical protein
MRLLDYSINVHSQTGEDGILSKILEMLPSTDRWCVEFGAWDGQYLSNTFNLIANQGYSGILIEGDQKRYEDLQKKSTGNDKITILNQYVGFERHNGLDVILKNTPIPKSFDLLSIDVDGNDYHIWKALEDYTPKIVCIEFNPTIPTGVEFVQTADYRINQGSSLTSIVDLAKLKGYELVAVTRINAIFVLAELFHCLNISKNDPFALREDISDVTFIFSGYDGTVFLAGAQALPWHNISYESRLKQLPKTFRIYPGNYTSRQSFWFNWFRKVNR